MLLRVCNLFFVEMMNWKSDVHGGFHCLAISYEFGILLLLLLLMCTTIQMNFESKTIFLNQLYRTIELKSN